MSSLLSVDALARDLSVRDLTDPASGAHAMQLLVDDICSALRTRWDCALRLERRHPIVPIEDNYDRLGYAADAVARDERYTRYVSETCVLRSHTSAVIPSALRRVGREEDVLIASPGVVYRRDSIDRLHSGTPHQLDLWRVTHGRRMAPADLEEMIDTVIAAALPGMTWRASPAVHPYTLDGKEVEVRAGDEWVEVLECGLAHPDVLTDAGLEAASGLAMGAGLDRLLMLRKNIPDIRLLRSSDPRVASQMLDLTPYRGVSAQPPVTRDLSIAVHAATSTDEEALGDRVRDVLGSDADAVESVTVIDETRGDVLPAAAVDRLGLLPGQRNVLVRIVLRPVDRTLTDEEANDLRDRIYAALHEGTVHQWASPRE